MKNQKGMSIIEVMFAIVILGMGMLAALQTYLSTTRNNTNGNILTLCMMEAKSQMEVLRSQNIMDLTEGAFTSQRGPVSVTWVITKNPTNIKLGRAVVTAQLRKKTVRVETYLNNSWGKHENVTQWIVPN